MENKYNVDEELFKTLTHLPHMMRGTIRINLKKNAEGNPLAGAPEAMGPEGPKCPGKPGPGGHGPMGRPAPMGADGPKCPGKPGPGGHGPMPCRAPMGGPVPMPGGPAPMSCPAPMPGGPAPMGCPAPMGMPGQGPGHFKGPGRKFLSREMILVILAKHEGGVRQKTLAAEMKVNPSSMSEFVDKLESTGYITRTVDPADKRATLISLTEKGEARAAELEDERVEQLSKVFCNLTNEEKQELIRLLNKLFGKKEEAAGEQTEEEK